MLDLNSMVRTLKRPRLLVRAARFGLDDYRRDRALRRILKSDDLPSTGAALLLLMDLENIANERRKLKSAEYSVAAHITLLTAIMGEARLLQAAYRPQAVT
ncbi:DUF6477 family protein [Yoonia sp. R2331]|uniref:DUF6477 family protein n=1 Tax=Yoonia sp. R2331 TaxID=3237238 RepID=UPI0034E5E107